MIDFEALHNQMAACRHSTCDMLDLSGDGKVVDSCYQCGRPQANVTDRAACALHSLASCRHYELYRGVEAVDPVPKDVATDDEMEVEL